MLELKTLSICNVDSVVVLYRMMIEENRKQDARLAHVETDDRSIRNLLQYSFDIENDLFFVAFLRNEAIGFIDSTRIASDDKPDEWYIKSVYLMPGFREAQFFETMVAKVERDVRQKGVSRIFSNAMMENDEVNALWETIGYEIEAGRRYKAI